MKQRFLIGALLLTSLVTLLLGLAYWRETRSTSGVSKAATLEQGADSGSDFFLEGQLVRAYLTVEPAQVRPNDSVKAVLKLGPLASKGAGPGLGNEHDGFLSPSIAASDCTAQTSQKDAKSTKSMIQAFAWSWSINCQTEGKKVVQITLAFRPAGAENDSDPVAFQASREFTVEKSPLERTLGFIAAISLLGPLISTILLVIDRFRTRKSA